LIDFIKWARKKEDKKEDKITDECIKTWSHFHTCLSKNTTTIANCQKEWNEAAKHCAIDELFATKKHEDHEKKEDHHTERDDGNTPLKDVLMKTFPRFFDSNEPKSKTIIGESLEKNIPQVFTKDEDDDDD